MRDETATEKARRLLPCRKLRGECRTIERAIQGGWGVDPDLVAALRERVRCLILGIDEHGRPANRRFTGREEIRLCELAIILDQHAAGRLVK